MEVDLNKVLLATMEDHMLYLYSSDVNKYDIQSAFLSFSDSKVAYVSGDNPKKIEKAMPGIEIVKPEKLRQLKASRIIFDGGSVNGSMKYEAILSKLKIPILCTYPAASVSKADLKNLVSHHTNMVFVTQAATVLSSKKLEDINFTEENIEKWIKRNLETVVLALVLRKPMSGKDIIKTIHSNFNILVSPGRLYPLLHDLSKKGLLAFEYEIRDKVYKPVGVEAIQSLISRELTAGKLVMDKFSALEL